MMHYCLFPTPLGWMGLLRSPRGLRRVILPQPHPQEVIRLLGKDLKGAEEEAAAFSDLPQRLRKYLEGERVHFDDPLDPGGSPFQRQVWQAIRLIPPGETRSYAWVAHKAGRPGAARAVGQALGANPIPMLIPCHRVVRRDGSLGGFGGGIDMKRALLNIEAGRRGLDQEQRKNTVPASR